MTDMSIPPTLDPLVLPRNGDEGAPGDETGPAISPLRPESDPAKLAVAGPYQSVAASPNRCSDSVASVELVSPAMMSTDVTPAVARRANGRFMQDSRGAPRSPAAGASCHRGCAPCVPARSTCTS